MRRFVIVFIGSILFFSCRNQIPEAFSDVPVIGFNYETVEPTPYDSIFHDVRFVQLETNDDCLIEKYDDIRIIDSTIFVVSRTGIQKALFAFGMDGRHLFTIDAQGRGPGEYGDIRDFYINPTENLIGILCAFRGVIYYDRNGRYSGRSIALPENTNLTRMVFWKGNYFAHNAAVSPDDDYMYLLSTFNNNWKHTGSRYKVKREIGASTFGGYFGGRLASNSDDTFFYFLWSDTIYKITDGTPRAAFALDFGLNWPTEKQKTDLAEMVQSGQQWLRYLEEKKLTVANVGKLNVTDAYILLEINLPRLMRGHLLCSIDGNDAFFLSGGQKRPYQLYPGKLWCYENHYYGIVEPERFWLFHESFKITGHEPTGDSEFSPLYFDHFYGFSANENGVIVFFSINEDYVLRSRQ